MPRSTPGFGCSPRQSYSPGRPDPWIQRKAAVGVGSALLVWSFYVVVGRACVPMILQNSSTGIGRSTGIGVLIGFVILFLITAWSYLMMLFTGPGFAKEVVPKTSPPNPVTHRPETSAGPDPSTLDPLTNILSETLNRATSGHRSSSATLTAAPDKPKGKSGRDWRDIQRPVPIVDVGPRWCRFCEINKPDRTHHCRHCGTCVMQFDHHCIWVGQCVGWANHKNFIIFNQWSIVYCIYMLIFLVVTAAKDDSVDGQIVGLIAVSALFGLFTLAMWSTHVHLIITGRSTVESFKGRDQMEQEDSVLQAEFGVLWNNQAKRKVKQHWKEEWGGVALDARWRWGSAAQLWRQEMGESMLGWIFPIGGPLGDGIHFRQNERFGPHGEWLRKRDWPLAVQV